MRSGNLTGTYSSANPSDVTPFMSVTVSSTSALSRARSLSLSTRHHEHDVNYVHEVDEVSDIVPIIESTN